MNKKITLHPLKEDGTMDLETNLYPKTNNIVNDEGESIEVATKEEVGEKQDTLVSGTNIKTINSESLLGSGNIAISGGTKLYQHVITFNANLGEGHETDEIELFLVSTNPALTITTLVDGLVSVITGSDADARAIMQNVTHIVYDHGTIILFGVSISGVLGVGFTPAQVSNFQDTVIEL